MIEYHSIQNILDLCKEQDKKIWEVVLQADMDESGASGEQVFEKMRFMYRAMQEADQSYEANLKSQSGMVGGDGEKMRQYNAAAYAESSYATHTMLTVQMNGKSIKDGRVECLYEENCGSSYSRLLWSNPGSSFKLRRK